MQFVCFENLGYMCISKQTLLSSDAVKSRSCRLHSRRGMKQGFFIAAQGTRGISPPNVRTKHPVISG